MYKFEFFVPPMQLDTVKYAVFKAGAGRIGNYDCCCWETSGTGQFRPLDGSNPFVGETGKIEQVAEVKVEMVCAEKYIEPVIAALKKAHPYETPAYQYWRVGPENNE